MFNCKKKSDLTYLNVILVSIILRNIKPEVLLFVLQDQSQSKEMFFLEFYIFQRSESNSDEKCPCPANGSDRPKDLNVHIHWLRCIPLMSRGRSSWYPAVERSPSRNEEREDWGFVMVYQQISDSKLASSSCFWTDLGKWFWNFRSIQS